MAIGLTFDEYVELRLTPREGADPAFRQAAEIEREQMFPMNTATAANHLRSRVYDCRPEMLDVLIKNGVVELGDADASAQADVDAAAEYFEEAEIFVPYWPYCERRVRAVPTFTPRRSRRRAT